jgi:hypothetical protein
LLRYWVFAYIARLKKPYPITNHLNQNMNRIADFVVVKDSGLKSRYAGDKVAVGHFIEDYMHQKIDLKRDFKDVMKHKNDIFTWDFTGHHYKFFLTRFIPEVLIHSQAQDERIIRSHYDDKNDLFNWFLRTTYDLYELLFPR